MLICINLIIYSWKKTIFRQKFDIWFLWTVIRYNVHEIMRQWNVLNIGSTERWIKRIKVYFINNCFEFMKIIRCVPIVLHNQHTNTLHFRDQLYNKIYSVHICLSLIKFESCDFHNKTKFRVRPFSVKFGSRRDDFGPGCEVVVWWKLKIFKIYIHKMKTISLNL